MQKFIIVGGVAGGATAAARLRRLDENAEIILFERGKYVSFANCGLPYYLGEEIQDRARLLVQTPEGMKSRFNLDVRTQSEVIAVDPQAKKVKVKTDGRIYEENYDALLLSPGAMPLKPSIPGIDSSKIYTLRSVDDVDKLKEIVDKSAERQGRAVVVGGGFIGVEVAENLVQRGLDVSLVEASSQILMAFDNDMVTFAQREMAQNNVNLILNNGVKSFETSDSSIKTTLSDGQTIESDFVVLAIGVRPDTEFLKDSGIKLNARGFIEVDEELRTNDKNIYAVGDAISLYRIGDHSPMTLALAGPANHQGRIAADNMAGQHRKMSGMQATSILKVFGLTAASTGRSARQLDSEHVGYHTAICHPLSHAGYYPGAVQMTLKVLFGNDGKLLGAQAVGGAGVDKRIDVLATMIRQNADVRDLMDLELCYAPPYSSAKDPVNMIGYIADDILSGLTDPIEYKDLHHALTSGARLVDVRTPAEFDRGHLEQAVNIPLDEIRARISEFKNDEEIIVYCQVGLRGYYAERILKQKGYKVRNLIGGYRLVSAIEYDIAEANNNRKKNNNNKDNAMADNKGQDFSSAKKLDLTGLCCPGPLMKLKETMDILKDGDIVCAEASDAGFFADSESWCCCTGNKVLKREKDNGIIRAWIQKGQGMGSTVSASDNKTIVVFSGDLDKALASFIIANGAASMGKKVTMFFTFWGLNVLRRSESVDVKKSFVEKMFGFMMPRGSKKLALSKMNMMGMGTAMMRKVMKDKNINSLEELIQSAIQNGIEIVACQMSMDVMGIHAEELIDGVKVGGVGYYLGEAENSNVNLFI